jgi:hypothetical protein
MNELSPRKKEEGVEENSPNIILSLAQEFISYSLLLASNKSIAPNVLSFGCLEE